MVGNSLSAPFELTHECMVHLPLGKAGLVKPCSSKEVIGNKLDGSCPSFSFCSPTVKVIYRYYTAKITDAGRPVTPSTSYTLHTRLHTPFQLRGSHHVTPHGSGRRAGTQDKAALAHFPSTQAEQGTAPCHLGHICYFKALSGDASALLGTPTADAAQVD